MEPLTKKEKPAACFMPSWTLPPGIKASSQGPSFAFCRLCQHHFSVSHVGFNDVTRHVKGKGHEKRQKEVASNTSIQSFSTQLSTNLSSKVFLAEVTMSNFIAQHNFAICDC